MSILKEEYEAEIQMCKKLSFDNDGKCNWGTCKDCGVIPLLYKLHNGKLLEDAHSIDKIKNKIINK